MQPGDATFGVEGGGVGGGKCEVCGGELGVGGRCVACVLEGCLKESGVSVSLGVGMEWVRGRIGPHEILECVGRGGMGIVFKARHEALGRVVAIKMLAGGRWADVEAVERFRGEAAAVSRLRHPGIVAVHEVGCHEGQHWYSMDYVEGASLAEFAEEGGVDPRTAVEWVHEIAGAIHYAHQNGVIHRDIKPSNILMDSDGHPRVTDFGLMREVSGAGGMTETGQVMGTPGYVPPEQVSGGGRNSGVAADVYGLGATLYHLLTGRPPFQGGDLAAVLRQVLTEEPVRPSRIQPRVNQDLETICLKCLEKEPARRYGGAGELGADLGRWLRHEPIEARPGTAVERVLKWARRHRALAAAYVVSAVLLGVLISLLVWDDARLRQSQGETRLRMVGGWIEQANALRLSGQSGSREQALQLLKEAAQHRLGAELEGRLDQVMISVLAQPEMRLFKPERLPNIHDFMHVMFDEEMRRCVVPTDRGHFGLVELEGKEEVATIPLKLNEADQVLGFSPGGRFVSFRRGESTLVWDTVSRLFVLGTNGSRGGVTFDRESRRCIRGEGVGVLGIYELPLGRRVGGMVLGGTGVVRSILVVPGGVVVGSEDGWVERWVEGELRPRWRKNVEGAIVAGAVHEGGRQVTFLALGDRMVMLDGEDGRTLRVRVTPVDQSASVAYSPGGEWLVVGHEHDGVRLVDASTGAEMMHHSARTWGLVFGRDGRRFGPVWERGRTGWLEYEPSVVLRRLVPTDSPPRAMGVAFGPGGRRLAVPSGGVLGIWEVESGRAVQSLTISAMQCLDWSWKGHGLAVGTRKGLKVWKDDGEGVLSGEAVRELMTGENVHGVRFSDCGRWLGAADVARGEVRIFSTSDGEEVGRLAGMRHVEWCVFDPTGERVVAGSEDPPGMWEARWMVGGKVEKVTDLPGDRGAYLRLWSPDGRRGVDYGNKLRIWEVGGGGREVRHGLGENNVQFAVGLRPDGGVLAATQRDVEIHLVNLLDGRTLRVLDSGGSSRIRALAFDPRGRMLAGVRERGEVQVWDLTALERETGKLRGGDEGGGR